MNDRTLQNKFSSLPEDLKAQVIDFIDFLLQKAESDIKTPPSKNIPKPLAIENGKHPIASEEENEKLLKPLPSQEALIEKIKESFPKEPKIFRLENAHFEESRKSLENYKGSFSDAVVEERRSAL